MDVLQRRGPRNVPVVACQGSFGLFWLGAVAGTTEIGEQLQAA